MPYVTNVTSTGIIQYRFTCEQCGETTPWYDVTVTRTAAAKGTGIASEATGREAANKEVKAIFASIKKDVDAGKYAAEYPMSGTNNLPLFTHYECPRCGAVQSWGVKSAGNRLGTVGKITLLVIVLYVLVYGALASFFEEAASAVWSVLGGWSIGIIPIILVVGLVADGIVISSQLKKKMAKQKSDVKNLPEINWNGMTEG